MAIDLLEGLMLASSNKDRISPVARWVPTSVIVGVLLVYGIAYVVAFAIMYLFIPEYAQIQAFTTERAQQLQFVLMFSIASPIALVYIASHIIRRRKFLRQQSELRRARLNVSEQSIPIQKNILCPRCGVALVRGRSWLECPAGHGFLLNGAQMNSERKSDAAIEYTPSTPLAQSVDAVRCPSCDSPMTPTPYQGTGAVIDICTHCTYRWLDGNEVTPILGE